MKKARLAWRVTAVLLSILASAGVVGSVIKGSAVLSSIELAFAATGAVQHAFGWPKVPRIVWRIFGPFFSILMIWTLSRDIGWFGTRLAVRHLTLGEQAGTLGALIVTAVFGAIVFVPLYRLANWGNASESREREQLAELTDTFA